MVSKNINVKNNTLNNFPQKGGWWEKKKASAQNKCGTK